ncbi:MAG: hypothetical protein KAI63_07850 [Planctomycetes bacterium]|nr:hypothetical protein [Planctomycetota bacterium]
MSCRLNEKGVADWVVAVFVLLACVSLVVVFIFAGQLNNETLKLRQIEKSTKNFEEETKPVTNRLIDLSPLVTKVEELEVLDISEIKDYLASKKNAYYFNNYDLSQVSRDIKAGGRDFTVEFILREVAEKTAVAKLALARANYEKDASSGREAELKKTLSAVRRRKDQEVQELKAQEARLNTIHDQENDKYTELESRLIQKDRELDSQIPVIEKEFKEKELKLKNEKLHLEQMIEQTAAQEVVRYHSIEPQGEIVNPDVNTSFAFINLGKKDNIKLGMKFRVFRKIQNADRRWKGQVEVKKIFETYSQVSITQQIDPDDPITQGDSAINIFYDPGRSKFVALIGDFKRGDFQYDRDEIKRRLEWLGLTVENDGTMRTDFVIFGREFDHLVDMRIKKLGIPYFEGATARESILYYLGD